MKRRVAAQAAPAAPRPCGHPDVTWDGQTAPACLWGTTKGWPLPLEAIGSLEYEAMEAAIAEHLRFEIVDGRLDQVMVPELLGPDGEPWRSGWEA